MRTPIPISPPGTRLFLLAMPVALALLLLAACGGEEGDSVRETPTVEVTADIPGADGTPAATATPIAVACPRPEEAAPGEPSPEATERLRALTQAWTQSTARVAYRYCFQAGDTVDEGTIMLYWRPPDSRLDVTSSAGVVGSRFVLEGTLYDCFTTGGGEPTCLEGAVLGVGLLQRTPFLSEPARLTQYVNDATEPPLGTDAAAYQRTVAGQSAECFTVEMAQRPEESRRIDWCFSEEGVLLLWNETTTSPQGSTIAHLEATRVSPTVTEGDLELPYPVTDLTLPGLDEEEAGGQ